MSDTNTAAAELKESIFSRFTADAECLLPGRPDEAIVLLEVAIALHQATGSGADPCLEKPLADLSRLYLDAGDYARALAKAFDAIHLVTRIRGRQDLQLATCFDLVVRIYVKQGLPSLKYAIEPATRSLLIKQHHHGAVSRQAADSYYMLGMLHTECLEHRKAFDALTSALHIYVGALGAERPEVVRTKARIGLVHWLAGWSEGAEQEFKDQLMLLDSMVGRKDAHVIELLEAQALTLRKFKRNGEAMRIEADLDGRAKK